ncbi:MAG: hypothetical protein P1U34_12180 [Coxiellaceae bacterium]|nr:hypothetical protein [Coxiellaceae bacterium]
MPDNDSNTLMYAAVSGGLVLFAYGVYRICKMQMDAIHQAPVLPVVNPFGMGGIYAPPAAPIPAQQQMPQTQDAPPAQAAGSSSAQR